MMKLCSSNFNFFCMDKDYQDTLALDPKRYYFNTKATPNFTPGPGYYYSKTQLKRTRSYSFPRAANLQMKQSLPKLAPDLAICLSQSKRVCQKINKKRVLVPFNSKVERRIFDKREGPSPCDYKPRVNTIMDQLLNRLQYKYIGNFCSKQRRF